MKFLIMFLATFISSCTTVRPKSMEEFQDTSVLISSNRGGGGSGVIFKSSYKGTVILTNAHICEAIVGGGTVYDSKPHTILAFKKSKLHDVCYLFIRANLHLDTVMANKAPYVNEHVYVSGHPSLYPHIVSQGYVAGTNNYPINDGERACTKKEAEANPMRCILDGHSLYTQRESTVVSALISPGSSGSAVFNDDGELVGLAFAAQGDIGYALVVPWKYLNKFVKHEAKTLQWERPDPSKVPVAYKNYGLYDLDNWEKILNLIDGKKQCLKLCP